MRRNAGMATHGVPFEISDKHHILDLLHESNRSGIQRQH